MTPLVAAKRAYEDDILHAGAGHLVALQAACLAYLEALATDDATVERVARSFVGGTFNLSTDGGETWAEVVAPWAIEQARKALAALTPTAQKETGE